ncbi:hypothetical protein J6590_013213 [Homalodisca vitripennis]|nr:hypothetical protein J6590_013213 [Homalodisca vitripennis]
MAQLRHVDPTERERLYSLSSKRVIPIEASSVPYPQTLTTFGESNAGVIRIPITSVRGQLRKVNPHSTKDPIRIYVTINKPSTPHTTLYSRVRSLHSRLDPDNLDR